MLYVYFGIVLLFSTTPFFPHRMRWPPCRGGGARRGQGFSLP